MNSTTEINAIVNKAKQHRADYVANKLQGGALAVAIATLVSLAVVSLSGGPSQDQAQTSQGVEVSDHHG
jgi:hypothetical protein